jgi:hypothetical protein
VPLTVDTSHALRTVPELHALVDAIFNGRKDDEDDAVEWKGEIDDVGAKRWTVEVARHAIGMGNRDPDSVATTFDGCGYVVLGVEPGRYWGVRALDPADADNKLAPYLGTAGIRRRWDTVKIGSFDVAVVTVEAPRWGDPIRCLEKGYTERGTRREPCSFAVMARPSRQVPTSSEPSLGARRCSANGSISVWNCNLTGR